MTTSVLFHDKHYPVSPTSAEPLKKSFVEGGRAVRARRGFEWLASGFTFFTRASIGWIGAAIIYWATLALGFVPYLGPLVMTISTPIFIGGIMFGCQELYEGRRFRARHIFTGFEQSFVPLLILGVLELFATAMAAFLLAGAVFAILGPLPTGRFIPEPLQTVALLVTGMVTVFVLSMAFVHAPALVMVSGLSAVDAIKSSFRGCLRNIAPFVVYWVTLMLAMGGTMVLFWVALQAFGLAGAVLLFVPYMIGFGSAIVASMFAAFRDIFYAET